MEQADQKRTVGVLVMSYGTPESMDQIEEYYTHIRRGNPPTPEQLKSLTDRYDAIVGGFFPLRRNTDLQAQEFERTMNALYGSESVQYKAYQGLKHARPYIEDGVKTMADAGLTEAVGIVLAPHYSVMSVGSYIKRAKAAAEELGLQMRFVESYHVHPKLIEALSRRVAAQLDRFEAAGASRGNVKVLFTAHSLPEKILEMGDPYPEQLLATSRAIAAETGVTNWQFAWQSAGATREPWLGPDILDVIVSLKDEGVTDVLVCPIGFVSDHLEVLYDLDIEAKQTARDAGIRLERTESLGTDPLYMEVLSECVHSKMIEG